MGKSHMQVRINLFGGLEVLADGKSVLRQLQQSRKTDLFLEYLILQRGRPVPHAVLLDALWSDRESRNPATALRTLLHRYRRMVEREGIGPLDHSVLTSRGYYRWNAALKDCEVDVYEFEELADEAEALAPDDEARLPLYRRMIELYRAPLQISAVQSWIVPITVHFQELYVRCVYALIDLLKARGAHGEVADLCRRAQEAGVNDERLRLEYVLALARQDGAQDALSDGDAQSAYDTVLQADRQAGQAMEDLLQAIGPEQEGAYLCEYPAFLDLCRVERALTERMVTVQLLCVMTLSGADATGRAQAERLCELAVRMLRPGDAVAHDGAKVAVLLTAADYEAGRALIERIKLAFLEETGLADSGRLSFRLHLLPA